MPLLILAGALFAYMSALFFVGLKTRNNGYADVGYGGAFIVLVVTALALSGDEELPLLMAFLTIVWGARLATRIYFKNKNKPEDFRYRAWRESWGSSFVWRSFLQIYLLQGAIAFVVALPVTLAVLYPSAVPRFEIFVVGVLLWVVGFYFEAVGDYELDQFVGKPENKGRIMTEGLWKYTRHPNYFGESLMWWGLAVSACAISAYPWVVFVSPVLITYLLLFVSGVPMLEKKWEGNPEWETYKKSTSVFVPLPQKKS